MPKRIKKRGTGITEHLVTEYTGDEVSEFFDRFKPFPDNLRDLEDWYTSVLLKVDQEMSTGTPYPEHSPAWFAFNILDNLKMMKVRIKAGNATDAAMFAYEAGRLIGLATLKFTWERPALANLQNKHGGKKGGERGGAIAAGKKLDKLARIRAAASRLDGKGNAWGERKKLQYELKVSAKDVTAALGRVPKKNRQPRR